MTITHRSDGRQDFPDDPLLPHVPARQRGPVKNAFLAPVRAGVRDPLVIRSEALRHLQQRLREQSRYRSPADTIDLHNAVVAIMAHPTEAEAFAQACIAYEQLPAEDKAQRKAMRGESARQAYMATQLPTDKQLAYLRSLSCATAPANRLEAYQLIDGRLRKGGA
jgi:hypothetical protein